MSLGLRLKAMLAEKKISQARFARMLNVSDNAVSHWVLNKGFPELGTLKKIAELLEVTVSDLVREDNDVPTGWIKIPILGVVPAGVAIEAVEHFDGEMLLPSHRFQAGRHFGLRVVGDSMEPNFKNRDEIVVDQRGVPCNGSVVVCRINDFGDVTLKRFYKKNF